MPTPQALEILKKIALGDLIELGMDQQDAMGQLFEKGLLRKVDPPRKMTMTQSYDDLQELHTRLVEAKGCLERIAKRQTPRSGLSSLFSLSNTTPPDHHEEAKLFDLLTKLDLHIRDVDHPRDVASRLDKIRDHLVVNDRECLDRMATIDREMLFLQRQPQEGTQVEPGGYVALTETGFKHLPESSVLEELDAVFNAVCGPRRHKIDDFGHFREDPANLLIFMLDNPFGLEAITQRVVAFETLIEAYEKLAIFIEQRSFRVKNAFLMRLCLAARQDAKKAYQLCGREKLQHLLDQGHALLGQRITSTEALLVVVLDLFCKSIHCSSSAPLPPLETTFTHVLQGFQVASERPLEERALLRLSLVLHAKYQGCLQNHPDTTSLHAPDEAIQRVKEARQMAPADLLPDHSRWLFGYHLCHLAGFDKNRLKGLHLRYRAVENAFLDVNKQRIASIQVVLHALSALQRLENLGRWVEPKAYAATYRRIQRRLLSHRDLVRALQSSRVPAEEEDYLAAYLTARTYFRDVPSAPPLLPLADVGLAGLYEDPNRNKAPLLGGAFGTLLIT